MEVARKPPVEVAPAVSGLDSLALIPQEELWLASQLSPQTRRAYRQDVAAFCKDLGINEREDLRKVSHAAVVAWQRLLEREGASPRTIRRKLSALSSLFTHLVDKRVADSNPVREVRRPRVNRRQGTTASLSPKQARSVLDAPSDDTLHGLRDRAILAVGFQVGPRRAEIASLRVRDLHMNQGFWSLKFVRKGGEELSVSIHPQVVERIRKYLERSGHTDDLDGPLFRPVKTSKPGLEGRRHLDPRAVDRILKKHTGDLALGPEFTAHSMRATFITTALDNGASLEDVQRDVGHADPSTTKLYDRRGHNPEKSASFFANY